MNTIAITGATSMLGVATIKQCIAKGIYVIAFVRKSSVNLFKIPKSDYVEIVECQLSDMEKFDVMNRHADALIHFGWDLTVGNGRHDVCKQLDNIRYTIDAVHLAQKLGCKKFIGAGSQAEYGVSCEMLSAATPCNPLTAYGVAKYSAGKFSKMECEKIGMEHIWIRIVSTYGTNDNKATLLYQLIHNAMSNTPMKLSSCEQIWDYLYEADAGAAFISVAEHGMNGKTYVLGSGIGRRLKKYVYDVVKVVNPNYKPEFGQVVLNPFQPTYLVADISELTTDTGWKPQLSFEEGIKRICDFYNGAENK